MISNDLYLEKKDLNEHGYSDSVYGPPYKNMSSNSSICGSPTYESSEEFNIGELNTIYKYDIVKFTELNQLYEKNIYMIYLSYKIQNMVLIMKI